MSTDVFRQTKLLFRLFLRLFSEPLLYFLRYVIIYQIFFYTHLNISALSVTVAWFDDTWLQPELAKATSATLNLPCNTSPARLLLNFYDLNAYNHISMEDSKN